MNPFDHLRTSRGHALPIMVLALTMLIIAVAVTTDGGNVYGKQRATQNGSDAAALAGAVALGNYGACKLNSCTGPTDAEIRAAIDAAAAKNSSPDDVFTITNAYYTDVCGTPLDENGYPATGPNGSVDLSTAAKVGGGTIPADQGTTANCSTGDYGPVAGVLVFGHRDVKAFVAGIIGINSFAVDTQATAVSAYGACAASQGCGFIPIAIPSSITTCNGGTPLSTGYPWPMDPIVVTIPLCADANGAYTYLDWTPPGGGCNDLIDQVTQGANSPITLPSWQAVTRPGNCNAARLQTALRSLDGTVARAPEYEHTCDAWGDSRQPTINTPPQYGCTGTLDSGNGGGTYWRLIGQLGLKLCIASDADCMARVPPAPYGAYVNGNNQPECDPTSTLGATACLVVKIVDLNGQGVGGPNGLPVQLIK
jgi:hypothetical protein